MRSNLFGVRPLVGVSIVATILLSCPTMAPSALGATINWGDLSDPAGDVMFLDVEEQNLEPTSLFAPEPPDSPTVVGNSIHFDPQNFSSQSSGGGANLLDSTLTTVIMANAGLLIDTIHFTELGDYTLGGLAGGQATASVGTAFFWTVLEINGAPVTLPTQTDNLTVSTGGGLNGGEFARSGDDGTAVPWEGIATLDVAGYLDDNGIAGNATKVRLRFNNTVQTASDDVSNAFIKKKVVNLAVTTSIIPEPSAVVLGLFVLLPLSIVARRIRN